MSTDQATANQAAYDETTASADRDARRLARIEEKYGDGSIYSRESCMNKYGTYMQGSAEMMLEAGKQLLRIKEHEPHGDFLNALEVFGIEPRFAQKQMQATVKFTRPNTPTLAYLGRAKLFELMVLDDEEIDELSGGGTVADLTLDEIERKPVSELRKTLRVERKRNREDAEAKDRLLAEKNQKIDELDSQLHRRENAPEHERIEELSAALQRAGSTARNVWLELDIVIREVNALENPPDSLHRACSDQIIQCVKSLYEMAARNYLSMTDLVEVIFPEWQREADGITRPEDGEQRH